VSVMRRGLSWSPHRQVSRFSIQLQLSLASVRKPSHLVYCRYNLQTCSGRALLYRGGKCF
jgi:hypothetical protein